MSGQNWFPPLDPTEFADEVDTGEQTPDTGVHSEPESENPDEESELDSLLDHAETDESEPVSNGNAGPAEETVVAAVNRPAQHLTPTSELADEDETGSATDPTSSGAVGVVRTLPVVTLAVSDLNTQPDWASEWDLPSTDPEPTPTTPDEGERIGIPEPPPGSDRARGRSRRTKAAVGGAAAAVLAVLVGGTAIALASGSDEPDAPASLEVPGTTTASPAAGTSVAGAQAASSWCPSSVKGDVISGNGPGGTGSGPDAILGFQYAFYVDRNADKARGFATPEAAATQLSTLQAGIDDGVPVGTEHCVLIRPSGQPGVFAVEMVQKAADGAIVRYAQTISTTVRDGKTLIAAINESVGTP